MKSNIIRIKAVAGEIEGVKGNFLKHYRYRIEEFKTQDRKTIYGFIMSKANEDEKMYFDLVYKLEGGQERRYNTIILNNLDLYYNIEGLRKALYLMTKKDWEVEIIK